jgi:hypothetical protein
VTGRFAEIEKAADVVVWCCDAACGNRLDQTADPINQEQPLGRVDFCGVDGQKLGPGEADEMLDRPRLARIESPPGAQCRARPSIEPDASFKSAADSLEAVMEWIG